MPRPRQPSHLADATQLHKGNMHRSRGADPVNESPLPPPPVWFNDIHREHWLYLLTIAAPGLLRASDHAILVDICLLWGEMYDQAMEKTAYKTELAAYHKAISGRTCQAKDDLKKQGPPEKPKPLALGIHKEHASLLKQCGLTPASRTAVGTTADPKPEYNDFADLDDNRTQAEKEADRLDWMANRAPNPNGPWKPKSKPRSDFDDI
jgi:hypothetical protein